MGVGRWSSRVIWNYNCSLTVSPYKKKKVLYTHIDQTLVNLVPGVLNCEIGGLDCRVI